MSVQKPKKSRRAEPVLREKDKRLVERSEAVCGLDWIRPSQRLSRGGGKHVVEKDETGNVVLLDPSGDGLVSFAEAEFVALYPEGHGKRLRLVVLRPHFEDGEVFVGGSRRKSDRTSPDDGHFGLWSLPSGRVVFRGSIPEDYEGRESPDGHYKDLYMTNGRNALSLFSFHPQYRDANKHLRRLLTAALPVMENTTTKVSELESPSAFVARGNETLDVRFLRGDFNDVIRVTELAADIMNAGHWTLPGLESVMQARAAGVVKDVGPAHISIEWADGSGELMHAPRDEIAEFIASRVPVRTANLPIYPLVREGEKIDAGTTLWGGSQEQFVDANELMKRVPKDVNEEQELRLLRVWALLAVGSCMRGKEVYPMRYVAPRRASEVYFRPAVSRVALVKHPAKVMCSDDVGMHFDFYTLSHRSRHWRHWREKKEQLAAALKVKTPAGEARVEEVESAPKQVSLFEQIAGQDGSGEGFEEAGAELLAVLRATLGDEAAGAEGVETAPE